jgi:hypothetical protein
MYFDNASPGLVGSHWHLTPPLPGAVTRGDAERVAQERISLSSST